MTHKKAHEVDAWLGRPDPRMRIVLVYGPDRGLVSERARLFAAKTGIPLDDPFSVVRIGAAEIELTPGGLIDEARTMPMFSKERLIWLREAGNHKGLVDSVQILAAEPPQDAIVLMEAGDLKKGAALRSAVESGPHAIALPCYADEGRGIDNLIDEELGRAGLGITLEARQALKSMLGGDRLASRSEIQKLALFCFGLTQVGMDEVNTSVGDVAGSSTDDAVDAILAGNTATLDEALSRMAASGAAPAALLGAVLRQLHGLQLMRRSMDASGHSPAAAVAAAKPPVFYSRKRSVELALQRWPAEGISRGLDRLQNLVLETRRRPDLLSALARQGLLALTMEAARYERDARQRH